MAGILALAAYSDSDSGESAENNDEETNLHLKPLPSSASISSVSQEIALKAAPAVATKEDVGGRNHIDPKTKEITYNMKFDKLYAPVIGPENPFKTSQSKAEKNTLSGYVEPSNFSAFQFENQRRTFESYGYAFDPSVGGQEESEKVVGDSEKKEEDKGLTVFESIKKRPGDKRKRASNYDSGDIENFTGPWAKFKDEKTVAVPNEEEKAELDEILSKRSKNSKKQVDDKPMEEKTTLHIKDAYDYQNRSFLHIPQDVGVNLKSEDPPEKCFIPKKHIHTWEGHSKGISAISWFPRSAHLLLSCALDCKVKIWEVYNERRCVRTYHGHKQGVRDVTFNNEGTQFLSAGYDRYVKMWDTETDLQSSSTPSFPYFNIEDLLSPVSLDRSGSPLTTHEYQQQSASPQLYNNYQDSKSCTPTAYEWRNDNKQGMTMGEWKQECTIIRDAWSSSSGISCSSNSSGGLTNDLSGFLSPQANQHNYSLGYHSSYKNNSYTENGYKLATNEIKQVIESVVEQKATETRLIQDNSGVLNNPESRIAQIPKSSNQIEQPLYDNQSICLSSANYTNSLLSNPQSPVNNNDESDKEDVSLESSKEGDKSTKQEKTKHKKPNLSYLELISEAILASKEKRILLNDIYSYLAEKYPYYKSAGQSWKNSIRHNLSIDECFVKAGRARNGRGFYWAIHPACIDDFRAGVFVRRQARMKVQMSKKILARKMITDQSSPYTGAIPHMQPVTASTPQSRSFHPYYRNGQVNSYKNNTQSADQMYNSSYNALSDSFASPVSTYNNNNQYRMNDHLSPLASTTYMDTTQHKITDHSTPLTSSTYMDSTALYWQNYYRQIANDSAMYSQHSYNYSHAK